MKRRRLILLALIILWAITVFYLSNQGSEDSSGTSLFFTSFFIKNKETAEIIEPYMRKIAHFLEYAYGGCLFALLVNTYKLSDIKTIFSSIGFGIWYAMLDEIHQYMVPGRTGRIVDVYIDTLGVATGVILIMIIKKVRQRKKKRKM